MNVAAGDQLSALSRYFQAFSNWEDHLKLYPDASYLRETEYHIIFIDGLMPVLRNFVMTERHDLMVFQRDNWSNLPELEAPISLHAQGIFNRLSAIVAPLTIEDSKGAKIAKKLTQDIRVRL